MKKVVTAIDNPNLNEKLKNENNIEIIGKDIQYKEAIIELLEKNKNIDMIIPYEKLPGNINFIELIKKIKIINIKIKLIIILEKDNENLENELKKLNINSIYYNNKINLNKLIEIINKKEINKEEELKNEIKRLKKIIQEKENKTKNSNIKIIDKWIKSKLFKENKVNINIKQETKIVTFFGSGQTGKTLMSLIISNYLKKMKKRILILDMDFVNHDLTFLVNYKNKNFTFQNLKNQKIKINKIKNKNKIKKYKKFNQKNKYKTNKMNFFIKQNKIKIKNNIYLIKNLDKLFYKSKNKKINYNKLINYFFYILKIKFDYIIIDLGCNSDVKLNKIIMEKSDNICLLSIANILGIKKLIKINEIYVKDKVNLNKINIIFNKYTNYSINIDILKKYFKEFKYIYKISYYKRFDNLINRENKYISCNKIFKSILNR